MERKMKWFEWRRRFDGVPYISMYLTLNPPLAPQNRRRLRDKEERSLSQKEDYKEKRRYFRMDGCIDVID